MMIHTLGEQVKTAKLWQTGSSNEGYQQYSKGRRRAMKMRWCDGTEESSPKIIHTATTGNNTAQIEAKNRTERI